VPPHRNTTGGGVVEGGVVVVMEFPRLTEKRGKQHDWAKAAV